MDCDEAPNAVLQCETVSWLTEGRQIKPSELVRGFSTPFSQDSRKPFVAMLKIKQQFRRFSETN